MSEYSGVVKSSAERRQGTHTDQNWPPTAPTTVRTDEKYSCWEEYLASDEGYQSFLAESLSQDRISHCCGFYHGNMLEVVEGDHCVHL